MTTAGFIIYTAIGCIVSGYFGELHKNDKNYSFAARVVVAVFWPLVLLCAIGESIGRSGRDTKELEEYDEIPKKL